MKQKRIAGLFAGIIAGPTSVIVLACCSAPALAQEAMETAAATMPSPGIFTFRPQVHVMNFGQRPDVASGSGILSDHTTQVTTDLGLQYGLVRDWSFSLDVPIEWEREEDAAGNSDSAIGVEDFDAYFKWRFYRKDHGGIDTTRAALIFGAEIASGDSDRFSSQSVNPHIGAVLTVVEGRWGFNQDFHFQWNTGGTRERNLGGEGPDDHITAGTAVVYRVWPDAFAADSVGAWYVTAEAIQHYETNGDYEVRFLPGVMYEGRTWALEAMLILPVIEELDERPELQWGAGMGLRFTF